MELSLETRMDVLSALTRLTPPQRTAIALRAQGYTVTEIAAQQRVSRRAIHLRLKTAIQSIRTFSL